MSKVCKDVGWDGQGFYCLRCGKAGFRSEASARGHLSQCKGRAIGRGVPVVGRENLPAPVETFQQPPVKQVVLPPAGGGAGAGIGHLFSAGGGAGGGGQNTTHVLGDFGGTATYFSPEPPSWAVGLDTRVRTLENEYNHLLMAKNQPQQYHPVQQDFFSQYKGLFIAGAIILFAIILSKQSNQCQAVSGSKGVNAADIGTKALSKLVDTGISKGVSALFK